MSTENPFQPAAREQVNARIALTGPAGSGKSFTALMLATNLAGKVAAVDTERGRLREHAGRFQFDHLAPARFDPRDLIRNLAVAAEHGYGAVVIDSLSHYWMGEGGALEFVDSYEGRTGGKFQGGWKDFRPIENRMWAAIMTYPGHVIATMRVKTAYVIELNAKGKNEPRKVGLKPEQREGTDYEFSIVGEMDREHTLTITKSTCEELVDAHIPKPGRDLADVIAAWCGAGVAAVSSLEYRDRAVNPATTADELREMHAEVKRRGLLGAALIDEHGDDTTLGALIVRLGQERKAVAGPAGESS